MTATDADIEHRSSAGPPAGSAMGGVRALLRLEAATTMFLAVIAYHALGGKLWLFAVLFFAPDLSMVGYVIDRRVGAFVYNVGHTYVAPVVIIFAGYLAQRQFFYFPAAIWVAHIGFDRMLGFGLKYDQGFGATHLGINSKKTQAD